METANSVEVSYHGKNGQSRSTGAPGSAAAELVRSMPVQFICSFGRRPMMTSIERQTMKKVYLRILPFCFVLYFICYLDRVNIGFAALTMNMDLGLSSYIFGLGAGAFFWGYFILEVPSNLILDRLGAPISTSLLELDGVLGVAGWRWLFFCEAAPAVIFGIVTFFYLTDRPAQADWLNAEEREWLATEMEKERQTVATGRPISVLQS